MNTHLDCSLFVRCSPNLPWCASAWVNIHLIAFKLVQDPQITLFFISSPNPNNPLREFAEVAPQIQSLHFCPYIFQIYFLDFERWSLNFRANSAPLISFCCIYFLNLLLSPNQSLNLLFDTSHSLKFLFAVVQTLNFLVC